MLFHYNVTPAGRFSLPPRFSDRSFVVTRYKESGFAFSATFTQRQNSPFFLFGIPLALSPAVKQSNKWHSAA